MDVQLFVYDLSKGLARQMSQAFLGVQIDAVYHTAIVLGGVEYFFGAGIQTCVPGQTHHGQPMEVVALGRTELDLPTVLQYLDSLKAVYNAQTYDLFTNNCNNFSNDFAAFLVGKPIPAHITSLPQTVLDTPFGQMLRPQLDQAMRGITQAATPLPSAPAPVPAAVPASRSVQSATSTDSQQIGRVHNVTRLAELDDLLSRSQKSCAALFFTSATCPPCKLCYPAYDALAAEFPGKATLIKVDVGVAMDIGRRYQIRATPTFITFLHGSKLEEWSGADPAKLMGNIRLLVQMAHPPHVHTELHLPALQRPYGHKAMLYTKLPPLDKLLAKIGATAQDPSVVELVQFIKKRSASKSASSVAIPAHLPQLMTLVQSSLASQTSETLFPLIDLLRVAMLDPRISAFVIEQPPHNKGVLPTAILQHTLQLIQSDICPYALHLVTLTIACNLFTSLTAVASLLARSDFLAALTGLISSSMLIEDDSPPSSQTSSATRSSKPVNRAPVRAAATALALNAIMVDHAQRLEGHDELLSETIRAEVAAAMVEALQRLDSEASTANTTASNTTNGTGASSNHTSDPASSASTAASAAAAPGRDGSSGVAATADEEERKSRRQGLVLALGLMTYACMPDGELKEVLRALDAVSAVQGGCDRAAKGLESEVVQVIER